MPRPAIHAAGRQRGREEGRLTRLKWQEEAEFVRGRSLRSLTPRRGLLLRPRRFGRGAGGEVVGSSLMWGSRTGREVTGEQGEALL